MFLKTKTLSKLIIFAVVLGLVFYAVAPASAQIQGVTQRPLKEIIFSAIKWLLGISAGLAILFIIVGGIYYVTAAGDESRMTSAKTIITYAVIGIFIIAISYSIVKTIDCVINPTKPNC